MEEVTALQIEVDRWLTEVAVRELYFPHLQNRHFTSASASIARITLLELLLKTNLVNFNHIAFSDASKDAKDVEVSLRLKWTNLGSRMADMRAKFTSGCVSDNIGSPITPKGPRVPESSKRLTRFVTTSSVSTASSVASTDTGLSTRGTSGSSTSPPGSRVASTTSSSNIASPLSPPGLTRSASVAPTPSASRPAQGRFPGPQETLPLIRLLLQLGASPPPGRFLPVTWLRLCACQGVCLHAGVRIRSAVSTQKSCPLSGSSRSGLAKVFS